MINSINLGDGNKVAQPAQKMVATENVMKVFKVTEKTLDKASIIEGAYLDLSADRVISISKTENSSDLLVYVSNYHTMIIPNDVEKINQFINEGLHWLVENWHQYKSVRDCGEYWEVELCKSKGAESSMCTIEAAKRVVFVMEHETAYFGRVKYKMHIFDTLNEAKEFRDYLIRYELSQMPLCADFEYKYDEDKDVFLLISEEGWNISYFRIYQEEDDGTVASYTLSFEERKTMDEACVHDPQKGLYVQSYNNFNKYEDDE